MTKKDPVNHPEHYETNGIECIDAIVASQGKDSAKEFCVCNAFKYIWRNKHKKNSVEDIKKAVWYLEKFLQLSDDKEYIRVDFDVDDILREENKGILANALAGNVGGDIAPKKENKPSWADITHKDCVEACLVLEDVLSTPVYYFIPFRDSNDDLIVFINNSGDVLLTAHMRQYNFDFSKMLVGKRVVDRNYIHKCANRKDQ